MLRSSELKITSMAILTLSMLGCDRRDPPAPPEADGPTVFEFWLGPADNDKDRLDNLIQSGLVGQINHNTGVVRINKNKWGLLTDVERRETVRIVTIYLGRTPLIEEWQ